MYVCVFFMQFHDFLSDFFLFGACLLLCLFVHNHRNANEDDQEIETFFMLKRTWQGCHLLTGNTKSVET